MADERLIEVGIDPSVGTVGDSYDNALAECVIGLFKTEVINRCPSSCQRRSKIGPRGGAKLGHLGFLRGARGGRRPVSRALHVAGG